MADVVRDLVVKLGIQFDDKSAQRAEQKVEQLKYAAEKMSAAFGKRLGGSRLAGASALAGSANSDPTGGLAQGLAYAEPPAKSLLDRIMSIRTALLGLGVAFGALRIARFIQHTADAADELKAQAERIGTTTQALQGLQHAAELSDTSAEALGSGLQFLARSAFAAKEGSKEAREAFAKLGVKVTDSNGQLRTTDQIMLDVADGLKKIESPAERTALTMRVMGRSAGELVPLLSRGSEEILAFRQELEDLGGSFSTEFVDIADDWNDQGKRMGAVLRGIGAAMGKGILPALNRVVTRFFEFWKFAGGIIRSGLEKFFAGLGRTIDTLGAVLEAFLYPTITAIASLVDWFGNLDEGLQVIIVTVGALVAVTAGWVKPWLLVAAAIGLVVEDIYTYFIGGDSITGKVVESFNMMNDAIWREISKTLDFTENVINKAKEAFQTVKGFFGGDVSNTITAEGATATASGAGASVVNAPTTTNQITVHAGPGMDEDALVGKMIKRLDEHEDAKNQESAGALVPVAR